MTQQERILERLEKAGELGVTNLQLNDICFRYGARIHELRKDGYTISTLRITPGIWKFVLHREEPVNAASWWDKEAL